MNWTAGSRRNHGSGTGIKSRGLFHPCTGVTAEKGPAGRRRQGPRHGPPAPVRGAGGRGSVHPGRSHRGGRRLAPGYPFDATIGGAKLVGRTVDAGTVPAAVRSLRHRGDPGAGRVDAAPARSDRGARGDGPRAGHPLPDRRAAPGRGSSHRSLGPRSSTVICARRLHATKASRTPRTAGVTRYRKPVTGADLGEGLHGGPSIGLPVQTPTAAANTPRGSSATGCAPPGCSARWAGSPPRWTTR
jgi:hypothetical protein